MINLVRDDTRLNHCAVDGVFTMQHYNILPTLDSVEMEVDNVFEIGTNRGGFTRILRERFPKAKIMTIDIYDYVEDKLQDVYYVKGDCFSSNVFNEAVKSAVGSKAIFCDGGNKEKEFNFFAEYLDNGDHILLHDYVRTNEDFFENYKGKIWNWHESRYARIKDACEFNGLVPFEKDLFAAVVWGSFYKLQDNV